MENTTSDYIDFLKATNVGKNLLKDEKKHVLGFYILLSINTGLRIGDTLKLTWEQLREDNVIVKETKTGKKRNFKVNSTVRAIVDTYGAGKTGHIFISRKNTIFSRQQINRLLKGAFKTLSKKNNISSHSLRKSFGRAYYDGQGQTEHALIKLSYLFNHRSVQVTTVYLGLRQVELDDAYDFLGSLVA